MRRAFTAAGKSVALRVVGGALIVIISFSTTLYVIDQNVSTIDPDTDRQGGDYRSVVRPTISVESCIQECKQDPMCRSWTLVRNGIIRPEMACLLKNKETQPTSNVCCTSGTIRRSTVSFFTICVVTLGILGYQGWESFLFTSRPLGR